MAVDSNFERLEAEVNRLLELLDKLRQDNAGLQNRVQDLESENGQLKGRIEQLHNVEQEHQETLRNNEEAKGRLESLLSRLDQVQL